MVSVQNITRAKTTATNVVKTWFKTENARPQTILDAFKDQLIRNEKRTKKYMQTFRNEGLAKIDETSNALQKELESMGLRVTSSEIKAGETATEHMARLNSADIIIAQRIKGVDSAKTKFNNVISSLKTVAEPATDKEIAMMDQISRLVDFNIPREEKYRALVNDILGLRLSQNVESKNGQMVSDLVLKAFSNLNKKNNINVFELRNYHGRGITPYITESQVMNNFGAAEQITYADMIKPLGYTRVNGQAKVGKINAEIQYGGSHITKWGDKEHFYHDVRLGKKLDTTKLNNEQIKIATQIKNEYKKLLQNRTKNPELVEAFDKYLSDVWAYARKAEQAGTELVLPPLPTGINPILSAENLLKLY